MAKKLITFSIIFLVILSGITVAQIDSADCSFCEWAKQVLKRLISIDDKICKEFNVKLNQEDFHYAKRGFFTRIMILWDPTYPEPTSYTDYFALDFLEKDGSLVEINDVHVYATFDKEIEAGSECELYINDKWCWSGTKSLPVNQSEVFYDSISNCINDLDIGEINKIEVDCPTFSGNPNADGEFDLTRIVYDVTWNKCE